MDFVFCLFLIRLGPIIFNKEYYLNVSMATSTICGLFNWSMKILAWKTFVVIQKCIYEPNSLKYSI